MKTFALIAALLLGFTFASAQNESAHLLEKEVSYKNWEYPSVVSGEKRSLRDLAVGKKLVMVVYFAPWCPNWKHDMPLVKRLYDTYKDRGFQVVGVAEYDPVESFKTHLSTNKIDFPVVYESSARTEKQKTLHYEYRSAAGDKRNWGSPWYIFLEPDRFEKKGDVLVKKARVVSGELIEAEIEALLKEKLGIAAAAPAANLTKTDICEPEKKTSALAKPQERR